MKCSVDALFKNIKVKTRDETLNEILKNKKSIARFGDGEFGIIFGKNLRFQKFNDILIIEGEKTRLGIGNDLFNNSKSIKRIICPSKDAFRVYEKILTFINNIKLDKNTLILISLGPTATALTYDILNLGNQIIDFGHFDIQYEYYLRNVSKKVRIPYKYVNEVKGGDSNITSVTDNNYFKQIIYNIS